jgi:hypothetical protein
MRFQIKDYTRRKKRRRVDVVRDGYIVATLFPVLRHLHVPDTTSSQELSHLYEWLLHRSRSPWKRHLLEILGRHL